MLALRLAWMILGQGEAHRYALSRVQIRGQDPFRYKCRSFPA